MKKWYPMRKFAWCLGGILLGIFIFQWDLAADGHDFII
jgi:hypothetical protein